MIFHYHVSGYRNHLRPKPQWAQEHNLEFNEDHHRWMKPGSDEPFDHPENNADNWKLSNKYKVGDEVLINTPGKDTREGKIVGGIPKGNLWVEIDGKRGVFFP